MHLAIDTSTDVAGIAVAHEFNILAELAWSCGQNHSVELMPRMKQLLEQGRIKFEDIEGIVIATGPGFNGLRVGVGTPGRWLSASTPVVASAPRNDGLRSQFKRLTGLPCHKCYEAGSGRPVSANQWQMAEAGNGTYHNHGGTL